MNQGERWVEGSFTTLEKFFKYTVMFFGLTNFPATFQIMMYKILWDLINTSEVASFIDDMIVGTKREKWYDKIV